MAATADLPPGARGRMWILIGVTFVVGAATYAFFGRAVILWVAGLAVSVLLYLLAGVELQLARERWEHGQVVPAVAAALTSRGLWIVLAQNGTVLHLTPAGAARLGHSPAVLVGQQL